VKGRYRDFGVTHAHDAEALTRESEPSAIEPRIDLDDVERHRREERRDTTDEALCPINELRGVEWSSGKENHKKTSEVVPA
jgi:hypothetical protein